MFGWIDFGLRHIFNSDPIINIYNMFSNMDNDDRIKILSISPVFKKEYDDGILFNTNNFKIASGFWTGKKDKMLTFIYYFGQELDNLLEKQIAVHDEMIVTNSILSIP